MSASENFISRLGEVIPTESGANKGVLPGQEGVILQRGGEELRLKKVRDRLTLCLSDANALQTLAETWQPIQTQNITPQSTQSAEIIVAWQLQPAWLDDALSALRAHKAVVYASHVYQLEASPGTYAYVANELTVQFTQAVSITQIDAMARAVGLIRTHALGGGDNTYCFKVGPGGAAKPFENCESAGS